jgi:transcriptional regulator with XRE-family HTH domain
MERSTIHYLKQKGWTHSQIAMAVGCHRDTVRRILREPVDHQAEPRQRTSQIDVFEAAIHSWLDENLSVRRMLEMARSHPHHPYQGGDSAFYDYVQPLRQARTLRAAEIAVRFEGLPGELLQIDWGEERNFRFAKAALAGQTRYRTKLVQQRAQVVNRLQKVLEDANIKLASVASNVLGASGRDILAALIDGETDGVLLSQLERGRLREKQDALCPCARHGWR